ncbi:MAG: DUF433 domain-containing protein [Deferrisomatales bacterium]|nr:DUF433 domain-containing protein [Deferrisomatales bacterium]
MSGYEYDYEPPGADEAMRVRKGPVVKREAGDSPFASFLDLVDLLFVKGFLAHGFSLQKIRKALAEAETVLGGHHFAQRAFFTDGKRIYLKVHERGAEALLQLFTGGQWVIAPVILQAARQIEFDEHTGFAERWYPAGRDGRIIVDPRICFGAPVVAGKGVSTSNVYSLFQAENEDAERVASWMHLDVRDVEAAVGYEKALAA